MKLQAMLFALLVLAANAALAACNSNMITGNWAFLAYGQAPSVTTGSGNNTNTTIPVQNINIIGVIKLQQGKVKEGWVTVKVGSVVADIVNITGSYTVGKLCVVDLNVSAVSGNTTSSSYRGTISLDGQQMNMIGLNPKETIVVRMDRLQSCNTQSLRGIWTTASIRQYTGYSVAKLETIDCTTSPKWCTFWNLGTSSQPNAVNATIVNVTTNADGQHPCMWTFQNGSVADGYIAVPFGLGMNVIQGTPKYSLATTYYRGAK